MAEPSNKHPPINRERADYRAALSPARRTPGPSTDEKAEPQPSVEDSDAKRPPLEVLLEAVEERGQPLSSTTYACSDRMLNALCRLDKESTYIALDALASISQRVLGDAQTATRQLEGAQLTHDTVFTVSQLQAVRRSKDRAAMMILNELSNFATIFARSQTYESVYDSISTAIRALCNALHAGSQGRP